MAEPRPLTRRALLGLLGASTLALVAGCSDAAETGRDAPADAGADDADAAGATTETAPEKTEDPMTKITLTVGETTFAATLADTEAARALAGRLPMTVEMDELNGNEKYRYLDEPLPAAPELPDRIEAGDLMLFGTDCLVLFYESFSTGYRYTRLGRVDDPTGIGRAVGGGSVSVTWELA